MLTGTRILKTPSYEKHSAFGNIITINPKEIILHPNSLETFKNTYEKPISLTNYFIENNELKNWKTEKKVVDVKTRNYDNYINLMKLPSLSFEPKSLVGMYINDITSPDELKIWINKSIDEAMVFTTINRVINMWIASNIKILKNHNNFLEEIYYDIITKYNKNLANENLKKNIKKFIDYWTENKKESDFDFNLYGDLINHLKKL